MGVSLIISYCMILWMPRVCFRRRKMAFLVQYFDGVVKYILTIDRKTLYSKQTFIKDKKMKNEIVSYLNLIVKSHV